MAVAYFCWLYRRLLYGALPYGSPLKKTYHMKPLETDHEACQDLVNDLNRNRLILNWLIAAGVIIGFAVFSFIVIQLYIVCHAQSKY